ncbi:hypothetical protein GOBAR_DD30620 [Gossypium barbadense]|nr:hypothetical protein GOBAR_DD30620 [Gossypium barbadense]
MERKRRIFAFTFNCFLIPSYFVVSFLPTSFTTLFLISTKAKRWSSNQYVYIQRKRKSGISPFQLPSPSTNSESQLIRDPASDRVFDSWVVLDRLELPSPPMTIEHPTFSALTRPLCDLYSLIPPLLVVTHKKLKLSSSSNEFESFDGGNKGKAAGFYGVEDWGETGGIDPLPSDYGLGSGVAMGKH